MISRESVQHVLPRVAMIPIVFISTKIIIEAVIYGCISFLIGETLRLAWEYGNKYLIVFYIIITGAFIIQFVFQTKFEPQLRSETEKKIVEMVKNLFLNLYGGCIMLQSYNLCSTFQRPCTQFHIVVVTMPLLSELILLIYPYFSGLQSNWRKWLTLCMLNFSEEA